MKRFHSKLAPRTVPGSSDDILAWIAAHGVQNKDHGAALQRAAAGRRVERRKGEARRMTCDLHGLTAEESSRTLRSVFDACAKRGVKELLVIHGRGWHSDPQEGPVLKGLVRGMLENELRLRVRDFRIGHPAEGGDGATMVRLM